MLDKYHYVFWERIFPGAVVTLQDRQTIEFLMREGQDGFACGIDLEVKVVRKIIEKARRMKWFVHELEPLRFSESESTWYLVVKVVDALFDIKVMYIPDDFCPGNRSELISSGCTWIFLPPDDVSNFDPNKLAFAEIIDQTLDDGRQVQYEQKRQGILHGNMIERGETASQRESACVLEYQANIDCENPELLLVEISGGSTTEHGLILLLQGGNVNVTDVMIDAI